MAAATRKPLVVKVRPDSIDALDAAAAPYPAANRSDLARLWLHLGRQEWERLTPAKRRDLIEGLTR